MPWASFLLTGFLSFFVALGGYRLCVEQVRGARPGSCLGLGFAFRGGRRLRDCFLLRCLYLLPSILLALGFALLLRSVPPLSQHRVALDSVRRLILGLGWEIVFFPVLMGFVLHPGRGVWASLRRGVPLGLRTWASITAFQAGIGLVPYGAARALSWLARNWALELCVQKGMVDMAFLWAVAASGLSSGLATSLALPYLRMAQVVFARERLKMGGGA